MSKVAEVDLMKLQLLSEGSRVEPSLYTLGIWIKGGVGISRGELEIFLKI